jgi:hypothetical protein
MIDRLNHPWRRPLLPGGIASPLNFMLEEERSAAEAYRHALHHGVLQRHPEPMRELLSEHELAARHLGDYADEQNGNGHVGRWSRLPRVVDAGSRFHIREAILWAMRDAEEATVQEYEECLENEDIDDECKSLIRTALLPKARKHLHLLEELVRLAAEEVEL